MFLWDILKMDTPQQFGIYLSCHIPLTIKIGADRLIASAICLRNDSRFVKEVHGIVSAIISLTSIGYQIWNGFECGFGNDLVVDEMDVNWMIHEGAQENPVLSRSDLRIVTCTAVAVLKMAIEEE